MLVAGLPQVVGVQIVQPIGVETCRAATDAVEVEPGDGLIGVDDLGVAMRPSEAQQVVAEHLRQVAHVPIGVDPQGAVALRQLGPVGAVDQRYVGERRRRPTQGLEQQGLPKRVGQVVVAADHMGDCHVVVVDHHRQHVGRRAVGAQQYHVVELLVTDPDRSLHQVVDHRLAVPRRLDADHRRHVRRRLGRVAVAPAAVVTHGSALGAGLGTHLGQLGRRTIAIIRPVLRQERPRNLGVARRIVRLEYRLLIPIEAQPAKPIEDRLDGLRGRALAVGILDAQQEAATMVAGEQPVEERRAGTADMQGAGGRGGESNADRHGGSL